MMAQGKVKPEVCSGYHAAMTHNTWLENALQDAVGDGTAK
jgi:hypothetical protein